ncbi:MAG: YoaP domain-containing protein [Bacteroidales bacterium]|nr:YoaP domain-containing protein [Bacteroidales bacterium]MCF8398349.1 YoaP domain-containing protein [Bacteroidales bacterium]
MKEAEIKPIHPSELATYGICGYKNVQKHKELQNKIEWYEKSYNEGLRIQQLILEDGSSQGMIEYVPGEYCWRPVNAAGYMFIHCLFVGYKKVYKGHGFASQMINKCIEDAKTKDMHGVAVVTRKSSFMVGKEVFMKLDFDLVDRMEPDFELLVYKFDPDYTDPSFKSKEDVNTEKYKKGLYILRADQCPYSVKNVEGIVQSSESEFGIRAKVIDLKSPADAQNSPCAFGTFCIIYNGNIISYHPISETRFGNIMRKLLK